MPNPWDDVVGTEPYDKNLARVKAIAEKKGYILNPDEDRLKKVVGLMTMNQSKYQKYYCPCKQSHPLDVIKDVLCPCPTIDEEVENDGQCFCKLFFKGE